MKRLSLLLPLMLFCLVIQGPDAAAAPRRRLVNIVNGFRGTEGFEVVKIGRLGLRLMQAAAQLSHEAAEDADFREALKLMRGIDRLVVAEYGDAQARERELFNGRVRSALKNSGLLMSVNTDGSSVMIYGEVDEGTGKVRDLVVFTPDECALVCIFGHISLEDAMKLAELR